MSGEEKSEGTVDRQDGKQANAGSRGEFASVAEALLSGSPPGIEPTGRSNSGSSSGIEAAPGVVEKSAKRKFEHLQYLEDLADQGSDRVLRERYAAKVYVIVKWWLAGVYLILILSGFNIGFVWQIPPITGHPFYLDSTVIIALLGATGAIGLLAIVLRGIFRDRKRSEDR